MKTPSWQSIGYAPFNGLGTLRTMIGDEVSRAAMADPNARLTDANFWKGALDADLLGRLRQQKGYQTRINAVLRTYMEAQQA